MLKLAKVRCDIKVKAIASQQKVSASSAKKPVKDTEMTWAEKDRLIEKRVKQDSKLLKVLAKL